MKFKNKWKWVRTYIISPEYVDKMMELYKITHDMEDEKEDKEK